MLTANNFRPDARLCEQIDLHTRRLRTLPEFTGDEPDDIKNDLWLHVLKRQHRFDPQRGSWPTYCDRLIRNKIRSLIRYRRAEKRNRRRESISVNAVVSGRNGDATSLHETIPTLEPDRLRLSDLDDDLIRLIMSTTGIDRAVLIRKLARYTHTAVQDDLRLSRRQFEAAWARIHDRAQELDLHEYLSDRRTS